MASSKQQLRLKVSIDALESRRFSLAAPITYDRLIELLKPLVGNRPFSISYTDDEGESVSICTDACLKEAVALMEEMQLKALKLTIKTSASAQPAAKVAPVEDFKEIKQAEAPKNFEEEEKAFRTSWDYLASQFLQVNPDPVGPEILGLVSILHKQIDRIEHDSTPSWDEVVTEAKIVAPKLSALPCFAEPESQVFLNHLEVVAKFLTDNCDSGRLYHVPPYLAPLLFFKSEKVLKGMAKITGIPVQLSVILDNVAGLVNKLNLEAAEAAEAEKNGPAVHDGVQCDICNACPIVGSRFKCTVCHNFDLCESCEASGGHPAGHEMIKFKTPKSGGRPLHERPVPPFGFRPHHAFPPMFGNPAFGGPAPEDSPIHHHQRRWRNSQFGRRNWANVAETSPTPSYAASAAAPIFPAPDAVLAPSVPALRDGYSAQFVSDVNIPDRTGLEPGTVHVKTWSIKNDSKLDWDSSVKLLYVSGNKDVLLDGQEEFGVPALKSGATGDVLVPIFVPFKPAIYKTVFRFHKNGQSFGDSIWIEFVVS